jgi:hypothetical protein
MEGSICLDGWAHDPVMRTSSCDTPVAGMKVMSVVGLVLVVNCIRLSMELLWRMWRLSLHTTPVFRGYATVSCGYVFAVPPYLAILANPGIRAFSPALIWCSALWSTNILGVSMVILEGGVGQTAELMFALDPQKGEVWKHRITRAALGSSAALVGGLTLAGLWLNSADKSTRHQGAALMFGLPGAHLVFLLLVCIWAQREQQGMRANMGQRSAEELKSGAKARKVLLPSAILLIPLFLMMSIPSGRELFGTTMMLALFPFCAIVQSVAAYVRVKKSRRQMTASMKVVPTLVRSAFEDQQHSITSTIRQYTQQKSLRRRKITVRESGVTLQFLEQLYSENQISEDATANDVVSQYVKPHTKDIAGQGSSTFVELIQEGETNGVWWCGVPTHMVSYSWKYTLAMMIDILHKFELENPPAAGISYRYYIDQFALDQHGFGKELGSEKEVQDQMLEQLNESIAVPGKMLCMLHPW